MERSAQASRERFRALAPVEFDPEEFLPAGTRFEETEHLLQAADAADKIFWQQAYAEASVQQLLDQAGGDPELREMVLFHYGPYDRLDNDLPFLSIGPKPPGAGFYPRDFRRDESTAYLQDHPEFRPAFESPYTVIRRERAGGLTAVPYHEAYREHVVSLSQNLLMAGKREGHAEFRAFLEQRARDVLTDDYYAGDSLWVRLADNPLDLVIGPCEVYEDQLLGLKAAYEAMLLARDRVASSNVEHLQKEVPSLCSTLEHEIGKRLKAGDGQLALSVANLIYSAGDARKAIPAIAFSLPNDERVLEEVGSRQVILKNVLEAKFRLVNRPLHERLLENPVGDEELAFRFFFDHTLFHEISHPTGPHRITVGGKATTVNRCLKHHYSILEEAKADTLAACFILLKSADSEALQFLQAYVPGLVRAIRFGLGSAHGGANAIQFNFLLGEGAIAIRPESGRLSVNAPKARKSLLHLVSEIIGIQERGDFQAADRFVGDFCVSSEEIVRLSDRVAHLPIDIRIRFRDGSRHQPVEDRAEQVLVT